MKTLKVRYKRTVLRKFKEGEYLIFDKEKGIINEDTGAVVVDIKAVLGGSEYDINAGEEDNEEEVSEDEHSIHCDIIEEKEVCEAKEQNPNNDTVKEERDEEYSGSDEEKDVEGM